jgi:type IV pilus assembly protein PilM
MAKRLTQALGVDIGTQSIKIAAVRLGRDGVVVSGLAKGATPANAIDHTGIYDPVALGGALKALLAESGLGVKDVIFSITGQSAVVVRNLEVPRMSEKELEDHMQWEIQRNIPFAESTVVSDFRPVDNPSLDSTQNMEVVMAVSPQSAIDMILDLVRIAGCRAAAIDVEPLALGRVLKTCHAGDLGSKKLCLVDIGDHSTAINMYRDAVLAFPRTVPVGGSQITKAIADATGTTMEEAEVRKISSASVAAPATVAGETYAPYNPFEAGEGESSPGVAMQPAGDAGMFAAMEPQLVDFVAELRRSIDYYRSRGGDVEQIALSGGGAELRGIGPYIEGSLGLPVDKVNPFGGLTLDAQVGAETLAQNHASEFAVAVGMGLHIAYD